MENKACPSAEADLQVIPYQGLLSRNPETLKKLYDACKEDGFFYINLNESAAKNCLQTVTDVKAASRELFDMPLEQKMLFDTDKLGNLKNYGYKPIGRNTGVVNGKQDGHELFLIPRDALLGLDPHTDGLQYPAALNQDIALLDDFSTQSHQICLTVLACLSTMLNCSCLTLQHGLNVSSTSASALIKYPNQEIGAEQGGGHIAHTDVGSLSLLFCDQPGLQVLPSGAGEWKNVKHIPGYAVVNVGDSLRHMSGRTLKSCLHRVVHTPSDQVGGRFSIIYFLRPSKEARFSDETGKEWNSIDWHVRKFDAFRHGNAKDVEGVLRGES